MIENKNTYHKEILFSKETIKSRVRELALQISSDYAGKEPIMIGILNGVVFFFTDLISSMTIPSKIDFIRAKSYGSGMVSKGTVTLTKDVEIPIRNEHVVIVEDIVDTGLTLNQIVEAIWEKGPTSIRICALIDKLERRDESVKIDYCGFHVEQGFLVGYGLDHDERYRNLPDICILKQGGCLV